MNQKPCSTPRRTFLKQTAMTGLTVMGAPAVLRGQNLNEKLNIAVIGAGGRGRSNLNAVQSENIVAVCDVSNRSVEQAAANHPKARKIEDFRKLYDYAGEFDTVVISTCEHTHAFATLPALQTGKHVYCEKPLTHNIWEARIIREAAAQAKVATQMGTQIHAGNNYRRVVELIQTKAIGEVSEVHVWVSRAWGRHENEQQCKEANDIVCVRERPKTTDEIPSGLDWDLWLGPAPARPFNHVYFPGPKWYRWWDFGNGTMSDLGSHWIDLPFWALDLDYPDSVEAHGPSPHEEIAPASMQVKYTYGARETRKPLEVTWYQGIHKPERWENKEIPQWDSGVLFVGDQGMLLSDYGKHILLPEERYHDFERPEPFIAPSIGHHAEWIRACKTDRVTTCNFEYAGWLTEANHLGNVAFRAGQKLNWNAKELKADNTSAAERFIKREYRKGWVLV